MRELSPHLRGHGAARRLAWVALPALTIAGRRRRRDHRETLLAHDGPESREEAFAELGALPPEQDVPMAASGDRVAARPA